MTTASEIDARIVARTWRLRWPDRAMVREYARGRGENTASTKLHLAGVGLFLARIEADEETAEPSSAMTPARLVRRAIYHARRTLADGCDPREQAMDVARVATLADAEYGSERPATMDPRHQATLATLHALQLSPDQRALMRAFLDYGCSSLADVDRLYGWKHGQAAVQAARVRRKSAA